MAYDLNKMIEEHELQERKIWAIKKIESLIEENPVSNCSCVVSLVKDLYDATQEIPGLFKDAMERLEQEIERRGQEDEELSLHIGNSDWMDEVIYDVAEETLTINTQDGSTITRKGVPFSLWKEFKEECDNGRSPGKFYHAFIKNIWVKES